MKKICVALLTLALIMATGVSAMAEISNTEPPRIVSSGDYDYLIDGKTASIVKYTGDADVITVPSEINEYQVTEIGAEAFRYRKMKSVSISGSILSIGKQAFEYCEITDSLQLPKGVTISRDAFSYARLPSVVTIPEGATVEKCAFSYCEAMEKVCIDPDVVLKSRAFGYCDDLKLAVCAEGSHLEANAFEYCRRMEQAILCGDVVTDEDAFYSCGHMEVIKGGEYDALKQSLPAAVADGISSVKTEAELPPAHVPKTGEYLYQALGDEKLAGIKDKPPVELSFHVDQGGYGRTAIFKDGDTLDKAVELLCAIKIGEESGEWVTDNYNWIGLTWEDGSHTGISLNLSNLEYSVHSAIHTYGLENLDAFWSYCAGYLEEDG